MLLWTLGKDRRGSSRNMYEGPMDKAKGGRIEGRRWGWNRRGKVVAGKWRWLYLNNNKKKKETVKKKRKEKEAYIVLPLACCQPGTWPATQACALTGIWTGNVLVHRPAFNPLSHTSQGRVYIVYNDIITCES